MVALDLDLDLGFGVRSEANRPRRAVNGVAVIQSSPHSPVKFFCSVPRAAPDVREQV